MAKSTRLPVIPRERDRDRDRERQRDRDRDRESRETERERVNNCWQQRKVGGAAHFSFHIFQYIKEIIMSLDLLLFKKLFKK